MASINFYIYQGTDFSLNLAGSGLGFYGSTFGQSVQVGAYQGTTYATDSNGLTQGAQVNNVQWTHAQSGMVAGSTNLNLLNIPNYQATLNIRFTHDTAVQTQNALLYGYDRASINNTPSGVTLKAAELLHTSVSQAVAGSGDSSWITLAGNSTTLTLAQSPGMSGMYAGSGVGSTRTDTRMDWYVALTCSPNSVSSKYFAIFASLEYL